MKLLFLLFGTLFGFLLSRAGATTFDFHAQLFRFDDLRLLWVIASAVGTGVAGILIMKWRRVRSWLDGEPLRFDGKPMRRQLVAGALMLGIGWGLTGSCPGTAPVMLGEGKLAALLTVVGIVLGTYAYGALTGRRKRTVRAALARPVSAER
jgi:uncharacterized membrane protein YedE/YeeE